MDGSRIRDRTVVPRPRRAAALQAVPRLQLASDAALAAVMAASLLMLGCRPNPPGEQEPGPLPDPDVAARSVQPQPAQATGRERERRSERLAVPSQAQASADILPVPGQEARGIAHFTETATGLLVQVQLSGLEPGPHGFHVHEHGDCTNPAETAGDHFSPEGRPHGSPDSPPEARHAGDLGNAVADDAGHAELTLEVRGLALRGERGIVGRSVIVHSGEDDFTTQPDGDAGDPIACGVIESNADSGEQAV